LEDPPAIYATTKGINMTTVSNKPTYTAADVAALQRQLEEQKMAGAKQKLEASKEAAKTLTSAIKPPKRSAEE
jgi:hypothetical protein